MKSPPQQGLSHLCHTPPFKCFPLPVFHSSRFEVFRWFLSRKRAAGHMQPWLLHAARRLLQLRERARQEAFPWVAAPMVPDQDLAQTQKSHFHMLFLVTESVPSPFHHAERQMLLMLALLLQEASVRRQLEITPYFSRVTKSRPWLLLLPAPL